MGLDWKAGPLVDHHNPREENQALADLGESFSTIFSLLVVLTILKNMKVNGKDYPIYEMENKIYVWNHQPVRYHTHSPTILNFNNPDLIHGPIGRRACVGVRWRATACVQSRFGSCDVWRFCHQHMRWFNCRWPVFASICHQHICFIGIVDDKHWSI